MDHRHFRQAEHHYHRDEPRDNVAQQDARASIADRQPTAEEQPGTDRATKPDHRDLGLAQRLLKALLSVRDRVLVHPLRSPATELPPGLMILL